MKKSRDWSPRQPFLLPPSPTEWLPQSHLVYFVLDVIEALDVGAIEKAIARKDPRGERPYPPRMMLALLIYGYCVGVFSSRRIARATHDNVAFRVLAGGLHPHFTTINEFRLTHLAAIQDLFVQGLQLCARAGMVKLGHVALDGAKILANASKHKAMSYDRMQAEEVRLRAEVEALLKRAAEVDEGEDAKFGRGKDDMDVPAELSRRESRLAVIQEAKRELEREAAERRAEELRAQAATMRAKAEDESVPEWERKAAATRAATSTKRARELDPDGDDDDDAAGGSASGDLPRHGLNTTAVGKPGDKAQRNFTDPESRIMMKNGSFVQAFNAQIAVDGEWQVVVAHAVTNQAPDQQHLPPMLRRIEASLGYQPNQVTADSGYFSTENVRDCERRGIDPYIAAGRETAATVDARKGPWDQNPTALAMRAKLATEQGRAVYRCRKFTVEPVFGQIEEARGFRRFSLRGRYKAACEWALVCLTHNLLKLFRHCGVVYAT